MKGSLAAKVALDSRLRARAPLREGRSGQLVAALDSVTWIRVCTRAGEQRTGEGINLLESRSQLASLSWAHLQPRLLLPILAAISLLISAAIKSEPFTMRSSHWAGLLIAAQANPSSGRFHFYYHITSHHTASHAGSDEIGSQGSSAAARPLDEGLSHDQKPMTIVK